MRNLLAISLTLLAGLSGSAVAAPAKPKATAPKSPVASKPKDDRPAGTVGSGAMTLEHMENLQHLIAQMYGISVNYVLPTDWEVVTKVLPGKGNTPGVFVTSSRKKMADPNDPTDFIFELSIFEPDITKGLDPKDKAKFDKEMGEAFKDFLDAQLTMNIRAKNKVTSRGNDIVPKKYGPQPGPDGQSTRPQTIFVPIHYQIPPPKGKGDAAELYTFTGLTGGHVWQMKFLVNQDMDPTYQPLVALMVNNTFALTNEQQAKLEKNTKAVTDKAKNAAKSSAGKQKSKGK